MATERFWISVNAGQTWLETTQEDFRRVERAMGFLPTAFFSTGFIQGTTLDPARQGKKVMGLKRLSNKWMCPQCGSRGVDRIGTPGCEAPLCHRKSCDYKVICVNISNTLYNRLAYDSFKAHAYDGKLEHLKAPQCVTCGKYVYWGAYDEDEVGIALRCIGCFRPQEVCICG